MKDKIKERQIEKIRNHYKDHFDVQFLVSEIERLKEENERLKNGGWVSVKDRLPNIGDTVLSIDRDRDQVVAVFDGSAFFDDHGMGAGIKHFTHWMPLPEPPEKGDGNE